MTAQPPARNRAVASARLAFEQLARRDRRGRAGGRRQHPNATLAEFEEAGAVNADGGDSGRASAARTGNAAEGGRSTTGSVRHLARPKSSLTPLTSWNRRSSPACRLAWEPWIVTLPNTATAAVAAIASDGRRVSRARSSATASDTAPIPSGRCSLSQPARIASSKGASSSPSAPSSATTPTTADWGANSRITVVTARHAHAPASIAAFVRVRERARAGPEPVVREPTASRQAPAHPRTPPARPAPTAIAMLCEVMIRCEPIGKAKARKPGERVECDDRQHVARARAPPATPPSRARARRTAAS